VAVETTSRRHLDDLTHHANHQGVMAVALPRQYAEVDDILLRAKELGEDPLVLVLDAIQDVANLGSLIRTAEVVGAHGVIIPEHRAAGLTPAVDKTSAGAVEFLPVARVTNITQTLEELKRRGLWCIGLASGAKESYEKANLAGPIALVVGNEGKGISRLVREHCDLLVSIPMRGHVGSLNAAVAGSVALYEIWRQRGWQTAVDPTALDSSTNAASVEEPDAIEELDTTEES
jgi:23S rRNA (guanosine2251-2'-O)-methyltransferase